MKSLNNRLNEAFNEEKSKYGDVVIITKKTGAGHYDVSVLRDRKDLGTFETTDMDLIGDIQELNQDGSEKELSMHDTFDEVVETCLDKLKK